MAVPREWITHVHSTPQPPPLTLSSTNWCSAPQQWSWVFFLSGRHPFGAKRLLLCASIQSLLDLPFCQQRSFLHLPRTIGIHGCRSIWELHTIMLQAWYDVSLLRCCLTPEQLCPTGHSCVGYHVLVHDSQQVKVHRIWIPARSNDVTNAIKQWHAMSCSADLILNSATPQYHPCWKLNASSFLMTWSINLWRVEVVSWLWVRAK